MPDMKEFAGLGLPVALTILSDYSVENKIMGLDCLLHITTNIVSRQSSLVTFFSWMTAF